MNTTQGGGNDNADSSGGGAKFSYHYLMKTNIIVAAE